MSAEDGITTTEEVAAIRKELEDARQALEDSREEATKNAGIAENAEKQINKWSAEVGDMRKEFEALKTRNAELESVKSQEDEEAAKALESEVTELESKLSPEGEQRMDAIFEVADESEKVKIVQDNSYRKAVLKQILAEEGSTAPSSWKRKTKEEQEVDDQKAVLDLFEKAKNRQAFVRRTDAGKVHGPLKPGDPPPQTGKPPDGPIAQEMFKSWNT